MKNMNTAQKMFASFGGLGHLVALGYFVDKTTMPKNANRDNLDATDDEPVNKKERKISYGKSLMAHFDRKRKEAKEAKLAAKTA